MYSLWRAAFRFGSTAPPTAMPLPEFDGMRKSSWQTDGYESIKKFAGEDFEKARYYPGDEKYLLEFEPNVLHCETFEF